NENSLNLAISQISKKLREPLLLYYYQDMSYEKIGETLGIPEGTVKSRINKAREKLAAALGDRIYQRKSDASGGKS
ncbi:MAG: RNA polymerase sigma factor, partial [Spirochaetia bacterium]|nr:RNA polymerase sigma factor [Spirochaetia bacterium]